MDTAKLTKLAIAAAALYAVYRFSPNQAVKAMVLGAAGTAAVMKLPYANEIFSA